ncbi:SNF2-related protein [Brachybacterium sp. AOP43-C2-M15]|uniref:SNF2-related protein n=1 Tax=Brachybacterium sp. AOP43-C2-M15 TaxID=3457661 RepID=UPI0040332326
MPVSRYGGAVTTYATLSRLLEEGSFERLDTLVVDHARKIKNPASRRSRSTREQIRRARHAILMTGTPIENRLEEFRTLIGYLDPELARSSEGLLPLSFRQHISTTYLRRNQEDVLKELPELNEIEDWIEYSDEDRAAYEQQVLAGSFMGMRRAAMTSGTASNKVERLSEIIDDATQNGRKVIVDDFTQASGGAVLLSQIQAGGEGLNIQAASIVVICEPQLKPSLETQAIARAYRMGQQRSVQVHRLLSDEGTDPRIVELLAEKTQIFDDYARESAAKDLDVEAMETQEVAIARQVVADERERRERGVEAG